MAESKPYLLPNTQGRYVTVTVTNNSGEVYRINDDATRTIYADYFVENNKTIIGASTFASEEFQRNLAQNSQGYNRTISNSILEANKQTNSQPNPNEQNTQGGESSTPITTQKTLPPEAKGFLIYPYDMSTKQDSPKQDRIKFTAVKYLPSGDLNTLKIDFKDRKSIKNRETIGVPVFLPIQASISDQNSADWQGGNLNYIDQQLLNLSGGIMNAPSYDKLVEGVSRSISRAFGDIKNSSNEIKVALAEQAVGVTGLLGRFGSVLNPNLELLFTGPQLRPFDFTFKMSARKQEEANEIKAIIKFFKKNMAPIKSDDKIFLRAPHTFFIEYQYGTPEKLTEHPGINKIKECALTNCAVDYTPNGTYMTYQDGTMVSYTVTLSFQELEPVYSDDYDTHQIGY